MTELLERVGVSSREEWKGTRRALPRTDGAGCSALKGTSSCLSVRHRPKLIIRPKERQASEPCARESGLYLEAGVFILPDSEAAAGFSLLPTCLPFRLQHTLPVWSGVSIQPSPLYHPSLAQKSS